MILNKLTIALIAIFIVASPSMGTSNSPIETDGNSSSLTLAGSPMADEADAKSNKRSVRYVLLEKNTQGELEEEEDSKLGQKVMRMNTPAPLSSTDNASATPTIPAWYYGSPMHAMTFEDLDYADLTAARVVSKEFKAMAKQVIMPTGRRWVSWFNNKFKAAKSLQQRKQAFQDIVWAVGRCPNALIKLREIVQNYYTDVPETARYWDRLNSAPTVMHHMHGHQPILGTVPIASKKKLFTDLKNSVERIKKLEAEYKQACDAVMQTKQPNMDIDLKNLKEKHNQTVASIKAQQEKIVEMLVEILRILAPYATASHILFELGERDIIDLMPDTPIVINKENVNVSLLANELCPEHNDVYIQLLTLSCLPSVHAALEVHQDQLSRASKTLLENGLCQVPLANLSPLDVSLAPADLITEDQCLFNCANSKIELLEKIVNNRILDHMAISQDKVRDALWALQDIRNQFLFTRIENYLKNKELLQQESVTQHVVWLMEHALRVCRPNEWRECSTIAEAGCRAWAQFIDGLPHGSQRRKIEETIAHFAGRAVILAAGRLMAHDLRTALYCHLRISAFPNAAAYVDQLFNEFNEGWIFNYFIAIETYARWAFSTDDPKAAKQLFGRALDYEIQCQQFLLGISDLPLLQEQFQLFLDKIASLKIILKPGAEDSQVAAFIHAVEQLAPAIDEKLKVLRAATNPQPQP